MEAKPTHEEKVDEMAERVLEEIAKKPGSGSNFVARLRANKQLVLDACRVLEAAGRIHKKGLEWCLGPPVPAVPGTGSGTPSRDQETVPGSTPPLGGGTPEPISLANATQNPKNAAGTPHLPSAGEIGRGDGLANHQLGFGNTIVGDFEEGIL